MKGYCWIQQHFPSQKLRCSFFENGKKKEEELFANVFGRAFSVAQYTTLRALKLSSRIRNASKFRLFPKSFPVTLARRVRGKSFSECGPIFSLGGGLEKKGLPTSTPKTRKNDSRRKKKEWGAFFIGVVLKKREEDGPFKTQRWGRGGGLNCQVTSSRPQGGFRPLFFHQTFRQKGRTVGGWSG